MQTRSQVVRFALPLSKADHKAIARIEREEESAVVAVTPAPQGGLQARTFGGEIYNLAASPKYRAKQLSFGGGPDDFPPAPCMALRAA